jgi:phytoene desaturase
LAPQGKSTLYVLVPVTHMHGNVDWAKEKVRYRNLAIKQLGKIGLHDVEKRICYEHVITPMDWQNKMEIYKGATFNLAHNLGQMLHFRPRNRFAELDGVYLVGGGTHPGSGLPVIYESARISSRLLLEDFGLPFDHCVPPDEYTLEEGVPDLLSQGLLQNSNKAEYGNPLTPVGR